MAGRGVRSCWGERAKLGLDQDSASSHSHPSQNISLLTAVTFCCFQIYKVVFSEKIGKKPIFKATDAHIRSFNLFQDGLGWVNATIDLDFALPLGLLQQVMDCSRLCLLFLPQCFRGMLVQGGKYISLVILQLLWVFAASLWQYKDVWCCSSEIKGYCGECFRSFY